MNAIRRHIISLKSHGIGEDAKAKSGTLPRYVEIVANQIIDNLEPSCMRTALLNTRALLVAP